MKAHFLFLSFIILITIAGCSSSEKPQKELLISAASSLTDVMKEIEDTFEDRNPEVDLVFNYGGSGKLVQQILQGAPTDVFLSASDEYMEILQNKGVILDETRKTLASNKIILITHKDNDLPLTFSNLQFDQIQQISIADPESVPAGRYAKEIFQHLNIWDVVQPFTVYGKNVRQVLTYVESKNVEVGVVYATDSLISKQVKLIDTADSNWHSPIHYPGAILKDSNMKEEATLFLEYLTSEEGQAVFNKYKFMTE